MLSALVLLSALVCRSAAEQYIDLVSISQKLLSSLRLVYIGEVFYTRQLPLYLPLPPWLA
jgi:hypothetical protein